MLVHSALPNSWLKLTLTKINKCCRSVVYSYFMLTNVVINIGITAVIVYYHVKIKT